MLFYCFFFDVEFGVLVWFFIIYCILSNVGFDEIIWWYGKELFER